MGKLNFLAIVLIPVVAGCATPIYKSPPAPAGAVKFAKQEIKRTSPARTNLSMTQADALARPIFDSLSHDASQICMLMAESDFCSMFDFIVLNEDHVNAYAGPNEAGRPTITLTKGLVEQFVDEPQELAMIVGHEFGHLLADHAEEDRKNAERTGKILSVTLAMISAYAMAIDNANHEVAYGQNSTPLYNPEDISYVISRSLSAGVSLGSSLAYKMFSEGQENEADYLGTYVAWRNGYRPSGRAFLELGALADRDEFSSNEKRRQEKPYAFWNSHPNNADRAARATATISEINRLHAEGQERPLPPKFVTRYARFTRSSEAQVLRMPLLQSSEDTQ